MIRGPGRLSRNARNSIPRSKKDVIGKYFVQYSSMSSNLKKWKITEKIHIKNIGEVPIFDITKDGAELIVSNDKNLAVFRILDSEDHAMYN